MNSEQTYCGPGTLREALDATDPCPHTGIRQAISTPEGRKIATQFPDGSVVIRWAHEVSGHAGSVLATGTWLDAEKVQGFLGGRGSWRPA